MKTLKLHITIVLTIVWSFSFSQYYTHFSEDNGLPSNHVYRITQDNLGFIWFITNKGMVRYNGKTFKTFSTKDGLPSNDIWDIRITPDNKVWYFTKAHKLGYILNDSVFSFSATKENKILFPISINQARNKILFFEDGKIHELKDKKWTQATQISDTLFNEKLTHPIIDKIRSTNKQDFFWLISKRNKVLKTFPFIHRVIYRGQVNDSLYIWISKTGYQVLNLNTLQVFNRRYKTFLKHDKSIKFVRFTNANNTIQLSGENFVARLDNKYRLTSVKYIPENIKSHFSFVDKNDNLWIATFTDGVYFFPKAKQEAKYVLENDKVGRLQFINDTLIANVYAKGFYAYDAPTKNVYPILKKNDFIFKVTYIEALKATFYITNSEVIKIDKKGKKTVFFDFYNNQLPRNLVYNNGKLYGITTATIIKLDPLTLKAEKIYNQYGVRDIMTVNNQLILSTAAGVKTIKNDTLIPFDFKKPFTKPVITSVPVANEQLIVCTDGFGAYLTDLKTIKPLEKSEFLSVQSAFYKNDTLLLATTNGILEYKKKDSTFKFIKQYTTANGLKSKTINDVVILDNTIIASSNSGISIIPIYNNQNNTLLNLYFEKAAYDNKKFANAATFDYTSGNQLDFTIATIDFSGQPKKPFNYKLEPIHKNWKTTRSQQLIFNNLQPNNYMLHIKSGNLIKTLKFTVKPLFWQRLWFRLVVASLIASVLFFVFWYLGKQTQLKKTILLQQEKKIAQSQLRALRSQMNPHFVFNSLSAIQYYITENDFKTSEKYLIKFSKLIRRFFEIAKEETTTVAEEAKLLKNYLDIEKLRFKDKLSFTVTVDDSINADTVIIPTMLLQPIVENAVNHGIFNKTTAGTITVTFSRLEAHTIQVTITDDGVGYRNTPESTISKQKSSGVLKDRMYYLNKSGKWFVLYTISDYNKERKDKGTEVTFTIKKL